MSESTYSVSSSSDSEDTGLPYRRKLRRRPVQKPPDSDDEGRGRKRTRNNAKVIDASWTSEKTVKITYDQGVKHACMNPIHGKSKTAYTVLHLISCPWKNNVKLMTATPTIAKSKLYQYCHKLCDPCVIKHGPRCFKCDPSKLERLALLDTMFAEEAITNSDDFVEFVKKWHVRRAQAEASFLVLHCIVLGMEARMLRHKFGLKRETVIHVVYSDVRDRMAPAGSGMNLEDSEFKDSWMKIMNEKVHYQNRPTVAFYGNVLLNNLSLEDLTMDDLLVMYGPALVTGFEAQALCELMKTFVCLTDYSLVETGRTLEALATASCLQTAVAHSQRQPTSFRDQCLYDSGNLIASQFYKRIMMFYGERICTEFSQRAGLGDELKIGNEGERTPFRNLYVAMGGQVHFRRGTRLASDFLDVVGREGDARSRVCTRDTSVFELVCWTTQGTPGGGDFVIPGLMYKFATNQGSTLLFRPNRFYHATLPAENRDLRNEKVAAAFITTT